MVRMLQLLLIRFDSGTSFDFNADYLPVVFRWRSGHTLEAFIKMMNTMLLMHKGILLVTNEMKSTALTELLSFPFCNQIEFQRILQQQEDHRQKIVLQ